MKVCTLYLSIQCGMSYNGDTTREPSPHTPQVKVSNIAIAAQSSFFIPGDSGF